MKCYKSPNYKFVFDMLGVLATDDSGWCVTLIIVYDYNQNNQISEKKFLVMKYNLNDIDNTGKDTELFNSKFSNIFKPYAIKIHPNNYNRYISTFKEKSRFTCPRLTYETI